MSFSKSRGAYSTEGSTAHRARWIRVTFCVTFALLALGCAGGTAQDSAVRLFDSVSVVEVAETQTKCFMHPEYIVVEQEFTDVLGADLFIRARDSGRCDADSLAGDFVVRNQWAEYFMGLRGSILFIDSGSGSDFRDMIIFDIVSQARLAELSHVGLAPGADPSTLGVWKGYELSAPAPGCEAPPGGLLPGVDSLFFLDIRTGDTRFAGETRCANRQ